MTKDWRSYKRHPLSAEHRDWNAFEWEESLSNLREHGIALRAIVLHDGMILDGWQFYRACLAADIEPPFYELPPNIDPAQFVYTANVCRRHESPDDLAKHAERRRGRVKARILAGDSTRDIARDEGVSQTTIIRDIEALSDEAIRNSYGQAPNGAEVASDATSAGAVACGENAGEDGHKESLSLNRGFQQFCQNSNLCPQCRRALRVGNAPKAGCPDCRRLRMEAAEQAAAEADEAPQAAAKRVNSAIESACRAIIEAFNTLPQSPWLEDRGRRQSALDKIRNACHTLRSAKCTHECPACRAEGCEHCHETGMVPQQLYQQMT